MVQSFHKVIDSIIIGVVGQIGSYTEPPGQVIAGGFAFSLNAARQIEDGNHADELGSLLSDAARPTDAPPSTTPSPPSGPMTRARAKILQAKVNSLLSLCDFDTPLDGFLLHTHTLSIIRYEEKDPWNEETRAE